LVMPGEPVGIGRLRHCERLRSLELVGCVLTPAVFQEFVVLENINELVLRNYEIQSDSVFTGIDLGVMSNLTELTLKGAPIPEEALRCLVSASSLQTLSLEGPVANATSLRFARENPALRRMRLGFTTLTDESQRVLSEMPNLDVLELVEMRVPSGAEDALRGSMPQVHLDIRSAHGKERQVSFPLSETACVLFHAEVLSPDASDWLLLGKAIGLVSLPVDHVLMFVLNTEGEPEISRLAQLEEDSLQALVMANEQLSDQHMADVQRLTGLKSLTIVSSQIGDASLPYVLKCRNLEQLVLGNTAVTDQGVGLIRDALPRLTVLGFFGCANLTDRSIETFSGLSQLTLLDITGTSITEKGVKKLKQLLPDCLIRSDYPMMSDNATE